MTKIIVLARLLLTAALLMAGTALAQDDDSVTVAIDADQPLGEALQSFADQSGLQVVFFSDVTEGIESKELDGEYTAAVALDTLLADTGLTYTFLDEHSVSVQPVSNTEVAESKPGKSQPASSPVLMAQNQTSAAQDQTRPVSQTANSEEELLLEEIVVVGTHIRGAAPVGAQVFVFDRQDIEQTGYSNTADVIQSLPQTLGAGPNIDTSGLILNIADGAAANASFGSSINLRGLGTDSTLTLVNGRRVSAAGRDGSFVDVSMVPLLAVERIEIMADGASALYGSDAIGGVVNVVLRDDYEGAETRVQYGTVTDGDRDDIQFGQVFGKNWGKGNFLIAYEYQNQEELRNAERAYAANSDLTSLGGDDFSSFGFGSPGTIYDDDTFTSFAIPPGQDGTALTPTDFVGLADTSNTINRWTDATTLLPSLERHSVFAAVSQELTDAVELFGEVRYTNREFDYRSLASANFLAIDSTNPFFVDPTGTGQQLVFVDYSFQNELGADNNSGEADALNFAAGITIDLPNDWQLEATGVYDEQSTDSLRWNVVNTLALETALADPDPATAFNPFGDGSANNPATIAMIGTGFSTENIESDLWSVNAIADGTLFSLAGADVKLAFGMDYREETLNVASSSFNFDPQPTLDPTISSGREVFAAFAEVNIPIVGESNSRPGIRKLSLSIAGRFEDYSDFGTTTNPRVGISWAPSSGLTLRGAYSESFRAPLLDELRVDNLNVQALTGSDAGAVDSSGRSHKLIISGGNPNLKPETSENWTVGFDLTPEGAPGFNLGATYFNIDISDRIGKPDTISTGVLADPVQFATIITRPPSPEEVDFWLTNPNDANGVLNRVPPGECCDVLVDLRLNNVSISEIRGMDLTASFDFETNMGNFGLYSNSTYYFDYKEAFTPTVPLVETVDTVNNQVDFRTRNSVSWSRNGFVANLFVNYVSGYTDDVSSPNRKIDSWTTADFNLSYTVADSSTRSWLNGVKTSLIVQNLFDEDPPFVNNIAGVGYDPTNSNPLGRFISVQVVKDW